jgi:alkylated DNA nucleotide flippase Atl1
MAERAIVLQVLREDRDLRWTRAEVRQEASGIPRWAMREAFDRLEAEGVFVTKGKHVLASRCAQRLDDLDLIAV